LDAREAKVCRVTPGRRAGIEGNEDGGTSFMRTTIHGLIWRLLGIAVIAACTVTALHAQKVNTGRGGLAIKGYDPVAYFTDGRPVKGDPQFTYTFEGATYQFASAASRDRFAKEPARYVPQFGGFCAWAVSRNYTADTDPMAWKVVNGKLYLNYSTRVQAKWEEDVPGNIQKGDGNWPALSRR
jgi:YHS domain-containing protein